MHQWRLPWSYAENRVSHAIIVPQQSDALRGIREDNSRGTSECFLQLTPNVGAFAEAPRKDQSLRRLLAIATDKKGKCNHRYFTTFESTPKIMENDFYGWTEKTLRILPNEPVIRNCDL